VIRRSLIQSVTTLCSLAGLLLATSAGAVDCDAIYTGGVQNNSGSGEIVIENNASINGGGTELSTNNLSGGSGACDGSNCTASGSTAESSSVTIQTGDASDGDIDVGNNKSETVGDSGDNEFKEVKTGNSNSSLTFSSNESVYYFQKSWDVKGTITMAPGDYWIEESLVLNNNTNVVVSPAGTVRIYVKKSVDIKSGVDLNNPGDAGQLLLYAKESITVYNGATVNGYIYSEKDVVIENNASISGGVSASEKIDIKNNATINYVDPNSAGGDYGAFCDIAVAGVDHFEVDVGSNASVCSPQDITLRVCANSDCSSLVTDYVGTVNLTTSTNHGDWAIDTGSGSLSPDPDSNDDGAASYTFVVADGGDVVLDLTNTHAETLTVSADDTSLSMTATSTNLTFSENAFVISSIDSLGDDVVAGRNHSFRAQMWQKDPSTGNCSVATNYNVTDVKAWITRDGNDPGGAAPSAVSASETQSLPSAEPGSTNLTLPFVSGVADVSLSTSDVGKYSLSFKDDGLTFSDQSIVGTSNTLAVRPFGFDVQVTGNPAATDESGAAFTPAGSNFTVTVRAVAWASGDDSDNDGIPDNHDDTSPSGSAPGNNASLSTNATLPSFGQEGVAEEVALSAYLSQPSGGTNPGLSGTTVLNSFSAGSDSTTQVKYTEVGIIEIAATINDGDYLGTGASATAKMIGRSGYVGRFVPARFEISNGNVTDAHSGGANDFTYLAQAFTATFDLEAQNGAGARTTNYTGVFAKMVVADITFGLLDLTSPASLTTRISNSKSLSWSSGTAAIAASLTVSRDADGDMDVDSNDLTGQLSNLQVGAFATDSDGVLTTNLDLDVDLDSTDDHVLIGATNQRFGRLFTASAWGPESAGLAVPLRVEYWNGSTWIASPEDETQILRTDFTFTDASSNSADISVDPITAPVGSNPAVSYTNDPAGNTTIDFGDGAGNGSGDAGMFVGAPGATGLFTMDVDLSSYPWLRFDWNQDGDYTNDNNTPSATINFETYRGHDRVIYWREVLQ